MTSAQRRDELEVRLKEACEAISFAVLANTINYDDSINNNNNNKKNNNSSNDSDSAISTRGYVSACNRLKALNVGVKNVKQLLK